MLSTLAIISIFTEIFAAGLLASGAYTFFRRFFTEADRRLFFIALMFLLLAMYALGVVASQMMYNVGFSISDLLLVHKILMIFLVLTIPAIWFFAAERFALQRFSKAAYGILGFALLAAVLIFIFPANLQYRENVLQPLIDFTIPLPAKSILALSWGVLGALFFARARKTPPGGLKNLLTFSGIGALAFLAAQGLTYFYGQTGISVYLLLSWLTFLAAAIFLFLGEMVPPDSMIANFPFNFFRTRLLFKLLIIFMFLIIVLIESTVLISMQISRQAMRKEILNSEKLFAGEVAIKVKNSLDTALNELVLLARTDVSKGTLEFLLNFNPMFDAIAVVADNGQPRLMVERTPLAAAEKKELYSRELVSSSIGEGVSMGKVKQNRDFSLLYAVASASIRGGGTLTARLNLNQVQNLVEDSYFGRKGIAYIVSGDGRMLAHPDRKRALMREDMTAVPVVAEVLKGKSGGEEYYGELEYKRMVGSYVPIEKLGWGVVAEEPVEDAYFGIRQVETNALMLILVSVIIAIGAGIFFARYIEHSIKEVIAGTEAVARGDLHHRIWVGSIDEVGQLAAAFNEMTRELRESQVQLVRSERLAALGTMAAGMAHEIKNPLVSLKTFTQLLTERWDDTKFREKFAAVIPGEIDQINRITESLLKFGRPSKPEFLAAAVNTLLDEVLELVGSQTEKGQVCVHKEFGSIPDIIGDPGQIQQAFLNMILNAVQAMPNGGDLYVRTDAGEVVRVDEVSRREKEMGFSMLRTPRYQGKPEAEPIPVVFIEIADTGTGIAEEHIKEMFDPFFTTKTTGTGMGLPITLRIIEDHGGSLKVRSEVGKGTSFIITLPQKRLEA